MINEAKLSEMTAEEINEFISTAEETLQDNTAKRIAIRQESIAISAERDLASNFLFVAELRKKHPELSIERA